MKKPLGLNSSSIRTEAFGKSQHVAWGMGAYVPVLPWKRGSPQAFLVVALGRSSEELFQGSWSWEPKAGAGILSLWPFCICYFDVQLCLNFLLCDHNEFEPGVVVAHL